MSLAIAKVVLNLFIISLIASSNANAENEIKSSVMTCRSSIHIPDTQDPHNKMYVYHGVFYIDENKYNFNAVFHSLPINNNSDIFIIYRITTADFDSKTIDNKITAKTDFEKGIYSLNQNNQNIFSFHIDNKKELTKLWWDNSLCFFIQDINHSDNAIHTYACSLYIFQYPGERQSLIKELRHITFLYNNNTPLYIIMYPRNLKRATIRNNEIIFTTPDV